MVVMTSKEALRYLVVLNHARVVTSDDDAAWQILFRASKAYLVSLSPETKEAILFRITERDFI